MRLGRTVAVLATVVALGAATAVPAAAVPGPTPSPDAGADPDGPSNGSLQARLAAATRAYVDAQGRLDQARKAQAELTAKLADTDRRLAELTASASIIANRTYRAGPASTLLTVFNSVSPTSSRSER